MKRAKVDAKRAARAAAHGFDAAGVVAQLEDFVRAGGDVKVGARLCPSVEAGRQQRGAPALATAELAAGPLCADRAGCRRRWSLVHRCTVICAPYAVPSMHVPRMACWDR